MPVITRGEREISLRFDTFPSKLQGKLEQRIRALTEELEQRVEAATPVKTGLLRSEIKENVYTGETSNRVAGYVSVFAGNIKNEYAKAATLEYGSNKVRKLSERLAGPSKKLERRLFKAAHIEAFRYLRGPFEAMRPEIQAALEETVAEAAAEDES
jgi:hypothetical protein